MRMKSKRPPQLLALSVIAALTFAACSSEEAELTTTSVVITDGGDGATTTTTPIEPTEATTRPRRPSCEASLSEALRWSGVSRERKARPSTS
jgi:hypothetical protein